MGNNHKYHPEEINDNVDSDNDDLQKLLMIPIENLEQKIKELEEDIAERLRIKESMLSELEHQRGNIEEAIGNLEFDKFNPAFVTRRTTLEMQMLNVEQGKIHEEVSCFRDVVTLKEKLRFAKEELKKQREKTKLLLNGKRN